MRKTVSEKLNSNSVSGCDMKIKYIGKTRENFIVPGNYMALIPGKIYEVIKIEKHGWYRIYDESGEDYMYPPNFFEVVEE